MRDRQCALNHDAIESASIVSSVINKPTTLSCVYHLSTDDNVEIAHVTLTMPLSGKIFFGRVGRAMISQCTKYEVSRFTRYEAVNGGAKCRKWCGLGWLGGTQGQRQCHQSIERI